MDGKCSFLQVCLLLRVLFNFFSWESADVIVKYAFYYVCCWMDNNRFIALRWCKFAVVMWVILLLDGAKPVSIRWSRTEMINRQGCVFFLVFLTLLVCIVLWSRLSSDSELLGSTCNNQTDKTRERKQGSVCNPSRSIPLFFQKRISSDPHS